MSELPVSQENETAEKVEPRTLHVSWFGLFAFLALFVIWTFAIFYLGRELGINTDCLELRTRRSSLIEIPVCSLRAGPAGWLYLVFWAAPFLILRKTIKSKLGD